MENHQLILDHLDNVPSPCFVLDEPKLDENGQILKEVQDQSGAKILLALKGYSAFPTFHVLKKYLAGTSASSIHEAILGRTEFGGELHVYAPAYQDKNFPKYLDIADHITFNSFSQWDRFKKEGSNATRPVKFGIRVNPEHSVVDTTVYDPSAPGSRLGVFQENFEPDNLEGITGFLIHNCCENNVDALINTFDAAQNRFSPYLGNAEWLNLGGGHHITRSDYRREKLIEFIQHLRASFKGEIFLEPGEAIGLNAGYLVTTVLDIIPSSPNIAILDTSATAHMPDVLEMPYRPPIVGAGQPGELAHTYKLGSVTCLAGDVIGQYSFEKPLKTGQKLIFENQAIYTMVKTTTFNGIQLPSIGRIKMDGSFEVLREFGYNDFKNRLG